MTILIASLLVISLAGSVQSQCSDDVCSASLKNAIQSSALLQAKRDVTVHAPVELIEISEGHADDLTQPPPPPPPPSSSTGKKISTKDELKKQCTPAKKMKAIRAGFNEFYEYWKKCKHTMDDLMGSEKTTTLSPLMKKENGGDLMKNELGYLNEISAAYIEGAQEKDLAQGPIVSLTNGELTKDTASCSPQAQRAAIKGGFNTFYEYWKKCKHAMGGLMGREKTTTLSDLMKNELGAGTTTLSPLMKNELGRGKDGDLMKNELGYLNEIKAAYVEVAQDISQGPVSLIEDELTKDTAACSPQAEKAAINGGFTTFYKYWKKCKHAMGGLMGREKTTTLSDLMKNELGAGTTTLSPLMKNELGGGKDGDLMKNELGYLNEIKAAYMEVAQEKILSQGPVSLVEDELTKNTAACSPQAEKAAIKGGFNTFYEYWKKCKHAMGGLMGREKTTTLSPLMKNELGGGKDGDLMKNELGYLNQITAAYVEVAKARDDLRQPPPPPPPSSGTGKDELKKQCTPAKQMKAIRAGFNEFYEYWKKCKHTMGDLMGSEKTTTLSPLMKKENGGDLMKNELGYLNEISAAYIEGAQEKDLAQGPIVSLTNGELTKDTASCSPQAERAASKGGFKTFYEYWKKCKHAMGGLMGREKTTTLSPLMKNELGGGKDGDLMKNELGYLNEIKAAYMEVAQDISQGLVSLVEDELTKDTVACSPQAENAAIKGGFNTFYEYWKKCKHAMGGLMGREKTTTLGDLMKNELGAGTTTLSPLMKNELGGGKDGDLMKNELGYLAQLEAEFVDLARERDLSHMADSEY